jgi:Ca2+-binding EF-hand superfamily protein
LSEALNEGDVYTIFATRAQANINQNKWKDALKDAQAMTAIEPNKSRGYLLQAKIFRILSKYVAEMEAYQDGLHSVDAEKDDHYDLLELGLHDAKKITKSILNDPRMMELFVLFDKNKSSSVDFKDVAIGLYQLTDSMQDAQRQSATLLLMMDHDDKRTLIYEKFAKLIMAMTAISGMGFDVMYEQLKDALKSGKPVPEEFLNELRVTQQELDVARNNIEKKEAKKKTLDALSYSRTSKLFEQWDTDKSGTIDFQELLVGLRKYQRAVTTNSYTNNNNSNVINNASVLADVEKNALMVMGHDADSNQELDKEEFAYAMSQYADLIHVDLHELIDFMCAVASRSEATEYEVMYSDATSTNYRSWTKQKHQPSSSGLGTIMDMYEEEEEEEEEDEEEE